MRREAWLGMALMLAVIAGCEKPAPDDVTRIRVDDPLLAALSNEEIESLADAVASMQGVRSVDNQLSVGNDTGLSGTTTSPGQDARH